MNNQIDTAYVKRVKNAIDTMWQEFAPNTLDRLRMFQCKFSFEENVTEEGRVYVMVTICLDKFLFCCDSALHDKKEQITRTFTVTTFDETLKEKVRSKLVPAIYELLYVLKERTTFNVEKLTAIEART